MLKLRQLREDEVEFSLTVEPEDFTFKGEFDKETEDNIQKRLNDGDVWAWCFVRVKATWGNFSAETSLGACSYDDEEQFKKDQYFTDMKEEVLKELNDQIKERYEEIKTLLVRNGG